MAKRVITKLVDDLDGSYLEDGEGETVSFSLDGQSYEIDLKAENAERLREALSRYINHGRRVSSTRTGTTRKASGSGTGMSKEQLSEAREWLRANGHKVSDRGRIRADLLELFHSKKNS